eukprot:1389353-Amorphochlora_amoeboformis.AAC.1
MPVQRGRRAVVGLILWAGITPSSQISRSALLLSDVEGNQSGEEGGQIGPIRAYQRKRRLKFLEDQPSKALLTLSLLPYPPWTASQNLKCLTTARPRDPARTSASRIEHTVSVAVGDRDGLTGLGRRVAQHADASGRQSADLEAIFFGDQRDRAPSWGRNSG